jgi:succinate dehydrogenase/fumarate reductase flavoprotein subunit
MAEHVRSDILCVGGGIGGLMAAIRAAELGADVVVAEKGHAKRSGRGGSGCDHYLCYIPEFHGPDLDAYIEEMMKTQQHRNFMGLSHERLRTHIRHTYDIVKLWDSWGIQMKTNGKYYFAGHAYPGGFRTLLKYEGRHQKPTLYKQARKAGAKIRNRVMIFDLVLDDNGEIGGAVGLDVRNGKIVSFEAKAVILGTGLMSRLYPSITPGWISNNSTRISLTGDGRIMAYRAGAELMDIDFVRFHNGVRYLARCGQATWVGVYRDPSGKAIGPFVSEPDPLHGDATPEADKLIFKKYYDAGRGPCYMDGTGLSEKDYQEMVHWLQHEGNQPILKHMEEDGIDFRKNPIEVMSYNQGCVGKIVTDEEGQTTIKGLYAIGDEVGSGVSNASVYGWMCGESAVEIAKQKDFSDNFQLSEDVEKRVEILSGIHNAKGDGPGWREANIALQHIMQDYAGQIRSGATMEAGLFHLRRLRKKTLATIRSANPHELGRSLEVMNLMDFGELVFLSGLDRKESRETVTRTDYIIKNPLLNNKSHIVKRVNGQPSLEWRPVGK